jgi:integrase
MSLELAAELRRLQVERERETLRRDDWKEMPEWVFVNSVGGLLDQSAVNRRFLAAMKRAGLSGHRLYDLRHSFATLLLAKGAPLTYTAAQLGHNKPTTTLLWYAHWLPSDDTSCVARLDDAPANREVRTLNEASTHVQRELNDASTNLASASA